MIDSNTAYVLDTSAWLALIEDEEGTDRVQSIIEAVSSGSVDQWAIDADEISQFRMTIGQEARSLDLKVLKDVHELAEPSFVCCFREAAFLYAFARSYHSTGKIVFLEHLQKMLGRSMFFKVKEDQRSKMLFKTHFQWPIAARPEIIDII